MIKRVAAAALMSVLLLTLPHLASPATAGPVQIAGACYDGAVGARFTGSPNTVYLPSSTGYWTTTSRCNDINFRTYATTGAFMQVLIRACFVTAGYCSTWKYYHTTPNGSWIVVASNVIDGTRFRLEITTYESSWGATYSNLVAF